MVKTLVLAALFGATPAVAADVSLTYQARILDADGAPINAPSALEVSVWDDEQATDPSHRLWMNTLQLTPQNGYVSVPLDNLDSAWFSSPLFVQTRVGDGVMGSRQVL